ncbi:ABC-type nitrate/sulfonate/bicarbonate transport system, permease component [Mycolicibacterium aurum]|uniref:ABC-type nitrate/sulfonate/bicarbonate transport system, permease component n=1 Tax=Mycolicibacterium aurum TaxID=1791 RepID=A0A448J0V3_MYCAU|nr:ABC-type nitrate/sulfonate/bicarbonate transport system, permease component [Mycolicibacterium aurum]
MTSLDTRAAGVSAEPTSDTGRYAHLVHRSGTRRGRRLGPGRPIPGSLAIGPVLLVVLWFVTSELGVLDPQTLPHPVDIVRTAGELWADGRLPANILSSLKLASVSLVIGVTLGLVLALISGLSRIGEAIVDGPIQVKRAVPTLAIIPLAIIWFGIGDTMKIIIIATSVLIPVYINTTAQLKGVDLRHVELAETVGLSRFQFIRKVAVPGALPGFFTGLRLAVTISWTALVVVEQVNATSGIGYLMTQARLYGQLDIVVVGLLVYAVFGLTGDYVVRAIERRALSWRRALGT